MRLALSAAQALDDEMVETADHPVLEANAVVKAGKIFSFFLS